MVKLTKCPTCGVFYDLEGMDLSASRGWVQCGECDTKFKAALNQVSQANIVTEPEQTAVNREKTITQERTVQSQFSEVLNKESEFDEHTIMVSSDMEREAQEHDVIAEQADHFMFDMADSIEPDFDREVTESERLMELDDHRKFKSAFSQRVSEFEEEETVIEQPEEPLKTPLEEELESNIKKAKNKKSSSFFMKLIKFLFWSILLLGLLAALMFQLHSRGFVNLMTGQQYGTLLDTVPFLKQFEKSQSDLSSLHLAYTRLEKSDDGLEIKIKLANRSPLNQAYPDFQLEFTGPQGEVIARKLVSPSMYLREGHVGVLEARETKNLYLSLLALPKGATGYQLKIVRQSSN